MSEYLVAIGVGLFGFAIAAWSEYRLRQLRRAWLEDAARTDPSPEAQTDD